MEIVDCEQRSAKWLAFRKGKIGATDIAVIMGISPYKSPYMLWQEKLGLKDPDPENEAMRRGKSLESEAIKRYCEIVCRKMQPNVVVHPIYEWAMASLDAISQTYDQICEIKCMGEKNHLEAMNGYVNPLYMAQMQWQMFVTGLGECDYFVYSENSNHMMIIQRDQEMIDRMIPIAKEFMKCLQTITPPPLTDMDYEDRSDDKELDFLIKAYSQAVYQRKEDEVIEKQLKDQILEHCNNKNTKCNSSRVTKITSKGRVCYDKIPELYGLELDKYRGADIISYRITTN